MANVVEVMAKLSGNAAGMVNAFKQATQAAADYKEKVRRATEEAVDKTNSSKKAVEAGKSTGSGFTSGFKGAIAGVGALAATVGFMSFVKDAAAASDATDKFKATMNFAGLDTSAIDAAGAAAKKFADQTVYDLPTIQNTVAQLASNGIKDYTGLTQAAGNLNAVAGGNAETFKSVAMMMTQTAGAGKLTTENWNQLSDAIPGAAGPLMRALEEAGAYTGNFREAMEKGQITSDEFNAALMKLGTDPIAVEAAKSTKTFEGAIGSLQAVINSGLMGALNAIKPAATGAISGLANGFSALFNGIGAVYTLLTTGDFTGAIGKALGVEEDAKIIGFFLSVRETAISLFNGIKSGAGPVGAVGETLKSIWTALSPAFSQIGTAVAGVLPAIMTLVQSFSPLSIAFQAVLPVLPILASTAGTLAVALGGALAGALQVIVPMVAGIVTGVSQAVTWFMSLDGAANSLAAGITALVAGFAIYNGIITTIRIATAAWVAIQGVLNAVMAINPVTLIIIGIALLIAAIVLLVSNWDTVVKFLTDAWQGFVNWFMGIMGGFVGFLSDVWNNIVAGVTGFAVAVFSPIIEAFNAGFAFIMSIFTNIGNFISGVWNWVFGLLTAIGAAFWAEHGAQLTAAWNFIVAVFTGIFNFYVSIFQAIGNAIAAAWNWITGVISGAVNAVWGVISSVFNAIWNFISSIFNTVAGFISGVWSNIYGVISGVVNSIRGVVSSAFNAVWGTVSSVFNNVASFISGIWNGILSSISGVVGQIGGVIGSIYGKVTGALAGAGSWLVSAGRNIVEGLISGVKSLAGTIGNAFLSMVPGWIVGPFKAALGIASPSKLFTQFGRWIIQGLGNGVNSEQTTAVKAMEGTAAAVAKAGSGITIDVPTMRIPEVPNIAASLALPVLHQEVRLNFTGTSPVEAVKAFEASLRTTGAAVTGTSSAVRGYDSSALAGIVPVRADVAPVINLTALIESPFGEGYMEARITDISTDAAAKQTGATARIAKSSRGVTVGA
ncbi:tape measure protein [Arthrobacter phage Salgado]|uniref:Tapemeasure protein n=2 Tax=Laroyevirus TaxID=1982086 RepID=A0A0U3TMF4_9CAUD|nr:tail length tape measure protein [Arthrobacter phage LiSara]YP_010082676.1 tail length tape measure protein [Arthrobacter phage Salgado]ALY10233.1 tape measure protein [Arthrobacter phage Salgado]ASR83648.1 tape measure protein [Arthrobacter phage LiSara]